MCRIVWPKTFEEYAKKQGWSEELMTDEYAPYCKEFYERAARIIEGIYPFYKEDVERLGGPKMAADIIDCFNASIDNRCMEKEAYEELLRFYEDIEKLDDDIYNHLGFIFDIFVELYTIYLDKERYW